MKKFIIFLPLHIILKKYDPYVTNRHKKLIECLEDTGILVEIHRFKEKRIKCNAINGCGKKFIKYEEKETDVAIAIKLMEVFLNDECDTVVLVTGDTDIVPAITTAKMLFPQKNVFFAFPYKRKNNELSRIAPGSFKIKAKQYEKNQFPDPYKLSDGTIINKPSSW